MRLCHVALVHRTFPWPKHLLTFTTRSHFLLMRVSKLRVMCSGRVAGGAGRPSRDLVCMAQLLKGPPGKACIENTHCKNGKEHMQLASQHAPVPTHQQRE